MAKTIEVAFSDEQFEVHKLTFGQIEEIMPLVPELAGERRVSTMLDIMQIAMRRDHPEIVIRDLPLDFPGMQKSFTEIMAFAGLEMKAVSPGEAMAGAKTS